MITPATANTADDVLIEEIVKEKNLLLSLL
jgi:hypothetical protein